MADLNLSIIISAVTASAIHGLGAVRQDTEKLKKQLEGVNLKQQLGADLMNLKLKMTEVTKSGNYTAEAVKAVKKEVGELATKAREAGINVGKLHSEMRKLRLESKSLNLQVTGNNLSRTGDNMRQQAGSQMAAAAATGYAIYKPLDVAAKFEDVIKDISITGNMAAKEEAALTQSMRGLALKYNQEQHAVAGGMKKLVETGLSREKSEAVMPLITKFATATRTDMGDSAKMTRSFDLLGVKDMELAFNQAATAGKKGSFEVANMAKWFPALGGYIKAIGVTGNEAVVSLAARMQIATRTAGSNDEAANNFKNFLSKLTSQDTIKDFKKQGIDLIWSMQRRAGQGQDPVAAGVDLVMKHLETRSPKEAMELKSLAAEIKKIEDPSQRMAELERRGEMIKKLGDRAAIGDLFQDLQAVSYLLAEIDGKAELKTLMDGVRGGKGDTGKSTIDEDYEKRVAGMAEKMKGAKIAFVDLGISIGNALMPGVQAILPVVTGLTGLIAKFAEANPAIAKWIGGTAVMFAGIGVLGFGLKWLAGGMLKTLGLVTSFAGWLLRLAAMSAGPALAGLKLLGGVVMWIGHALRMNPIGLLITGIAVAAFLIYKYWAPISGFFAKGWALVKTSFFNTWNWFKTLPGMFKQMGVDLIDGLIGGVTSKLQAAKTTIVGFGNDIKGWFSSTLGIKSPSRVFMGFGSNIGQGAEIGIKNSVPGVKSAVSKLAGVALAGAAFAGGGAAMAGGHSAAGGINITFAPQITITGGGTSAGEGVREALNLSVRDLERMMRRVMAEQSRVAF